MRPLVIARAVGAILSILTLLGLFVADFLLIEHVLDREVVLILLGLIASLLGISRIRALSLPDSISISFNDEEE